MSLDADVAASATDHDAPTLWTEAEPARLARDIAEVAALAPDLVYSPPGVSAEHGSWAGRLPRWPFDREEPPGLDNLIGPVGIKIELVYSAAHPMVPPAIYPLDPEPDVMERTQSAWHVAPDGSLCLLQSDGAWQPEASVIELLVKACAWRIEYALMKAGLIERMTVNGIVSDHSLDGLIAQRSTGGRAPEGQAEVSDGPI